jgi:hypothetical protein
MKINLTILVCEMFVAKCYIVNTTFLPSELSNDRNPNHMWEETAMV